jgi:methylenetetrahydrofolate dehydrogenase (NADP+)/methenyltetrahydrofolate cyclohydrolase
MIIDGRKIAEEVLDQLRQEVSDKELMLRLGAILVGDDPEFKKFVELKAKVAEKAGIDFTIYKFPKEIGTEELKKSMHEIVEWSDGVLVELPLPKQIDQQAILNEVPVKKDVDVLSDEAQRLFYENKSKINPPAVEALKIVLEKNNISLKEKKVAVFGQGILIGKPISHWLEQQGAEVSKIRSTTENPKKLSLEADIIVAGVGKPGLIMGDMVQEGVVVIDFGYAKKGDKMEGDIDFDSVLPKASIITPVPGGMGPILIVAVLKNLIKLNP